MKKNTNAPYRVVAFSEKAHFAVDYDGAHSKDHYSCMSVGVVQE